MKKARLVFAALATAAAAAEAQVKERWRLQFDHEKPQLYTYRTPNDRYENYWYFVYTVENATDQIVPAIVDVMLYTEAGKDLQNDFRRVDAPVIKEAREFPRRAEPLKFGRFYTNVIDPETECKIIEHHAKIGNRSDGIVRESIEAFKKGFAADPPPQFAGRWKKGDRLYLNPREMREHRWIQPGQKLMGIAIFKGVDPRATVYEMHVWGLVDIIKIVAVTEDEWKMEYEPVTLKIRWQRHGDEFEIENDYLHRLTLARKEYVVKKIGPVAAKETLDNLVLALADILKKEKDWKDQNKSADDIAKLRAAEGLGPLDARIMATVFKLATEKDFGYDGSKDVVENEKAVWRIHEWWITNRTRILFNEAVNRFEVKDEVLPGAAEK
jgi:hypothetical protein